MDSEVQAMETSKEKEIKEYIIDETAIKAGSSDLVWLWVVIEPKDKEILATDISKKRNMFIPKAVLSKVINNYLDHILFLLNRGALPTSLQIFETKTSSSFSL